ncbi:hypothetical protein UA08_04026 [Talaromyces atroroseus]|uniref:Uncharacterized protein n=1 Tax=Talaromyces atroroseus TaxID=1441469 RepID=A0A1Q5Q9N4_TALAT|nr:hypothetical protein UA08_04026 [Talaromyces atroroseus]OKL60670.1 hypothetical protein UA08_04026 [Talaromyces atroroseus]
MATKPQFQLFPSPAKDRKNPFRNIPNRRDESRNRSQSPVSPETEADLKSELQTESVIIKIIEDTKSDAIQPRSESRQSSRPDITMQTQLDTRQLQSRSVSPGLPINSMFPQYNHHLPLDRQAYFPQNRDSDNAPQREQSSSSAGRAFPTTRISPGDVDAVFGPKTVPASVLNFPTEDLSPRIEYSTAEELLTLWESANGQELQESLGTFNLRMERVEDNTFTFGNPQLPFYTLRASMNGVSILRNHPLKQNRGVEVMGLSLESPIRRRPPHDGLVTVIFSKLAAMLAVEQAAELARQHALAPSEAVEIETNAVSRAAAQESCRLIWNAPQRRYELQHPSLLQQVSSPLLGQDGIPVSLVQTAKPGILHITVSPSAESDSQQPPVIMVTSPKSPNSIPAGNSAATSRTSTLPQADIDEPLASLDLDTMTLSICAGLTTSKIPSLYAIDSLVAAMLAVAITDDSTYPVLANAELYVPGLISEQLQQEPPQAGQQQPRQKNRGFRNSFTLATAKSTANTATTTNTFAGTYYTTFAERVDAEQEAKLMSKIHAKEAKKHAKRKDNANSHKNKNKKGGFFSFLGGSKKNKNKTESDTEEFDMEKYGNTEEWSGKDDNKLPLLIRMIVAVVVFGVKVVVVVLVAGAKFAIWLLNKCLGSD